MLRFRGEEALTYDDVLLVPKYSEVLPREVKVATLFSRHIEINIPIVSAAMDTVTEARMAIALARQGGIGVIHKNMSIEAQVAEVMRVKRSESWMITDPYTLNPKNSLKEAKELMDRHEIASIPIIDKKGKLVGIITKRDLRFVKNLKRKIGEVMTKELITVSPDVTGKKAEDIMHKHKVEKLLVTHEDGRLYGLITAKDIEMRTQFPDACKDKKGRLRVGAAVGVSEDSMDRVRALNKAGADAIVIDTAHAHSRGVIELVKEIKKKLPKVELVVGNIATPEAAEALCSLDVDGIKVGIGPGSICTTRVIAGIGVPQLTAVDWCVEVAKRHGVPVNADGGIRWSGDIVKALAAGAGSVMLGNLLAGTEESPGVKVLYQGKRYVEYEGMGSLGCMERGSADRYSQEGAKKFVSEGVEGRVPYRGRVDEVVYQLVGGLRSGMGYCGAANIKELQEKAEWVRITLAGIRESHPSVDITKEPPNYFGVLQRGWL